MGVSVVPLPAELLSSGVLICKSDGRPRNEGGGARNGAKARAANSATSGLRKAASNPSRKSSRTKRMSTHTNQFHAKVIPTKITRRTTQGNTRIHDFISSHFVRSRVQCTGFSVIISIFAPEPQAICEGAEVKCNTTWFNKPSIPSALLAGKRPARAAAKNPRSNGHVVRHFVRHFVPCRCR